MRKYLLLHWMIWGTLVVSTGGWFGLHHLSTKQQIMPLVLTEGAKVYLNVPRAQHAKLDAAIHFSKSAKELPAVGRLPAILFSTKGLLTLHEPGESLTFDVTLNERAYEVQALPHTRPIAFRAVRPLAVAQSEPIVFGPGRNDLELVVKQVGPGLRGELASLVVYPSQPAAIRLPGGIKINQQFLWPALAGLLCAYAVALLALSRRPKVFVAHPMEPSP